MKHRLFRWNMSSLCIISIFLTLTVRGINTQGLFINPTCSDVTPNGVTEYTVCGSAPIPSSILYNETGGQFNYSIDPDSYTCGSQPQNFCDASSLVITCAKCDKSQPALAHNPNNMFDTKEGDQNLSSWWQSITWDVIGVNKNLAVNITLCFDHLYELQNTLTVTFKSMRPRSANLWKSRDGGKSWLPWQRYRENCDAEYASGIPARPTVTNPSAVVCTTQYSQVPPYRDGILGFDVNERFKLFLTETFTNYASLFMAFNNTDLQEFLMFNCIRLELLQPGGVGRPQDLLTWYYAISDISLQSSCSCNGHARSCSLGADGRTKCDCEHFTDGVNCEKCLPLYNNRLWKKAYMAPYPRGVANICQACQCHQHAESCTYNPGYGHGVCDMCLHNTTGLFCESCQSGFYPNASTALTDINRCQPCNCEPLGTFNGNLACESVTGQCTCKADVSGRRCDLCKDGTYGLLLNDSTAGTCKPCSCHPYGMMNTFVFCEKELGQCPCKPNIGMRDCSECKDGFYSFPDGRPTGDCIVCDCNPGGSITMNCNKITGQCQCRTGLIGRRCDQPISDTYIPRLDYFRLQPIGGTARLDTALLTSKIPFTGSVFSVGGPGDTVQLNNIEGNQFQPDYIWSYMPALSYSQSNKGSWNGSKITISQIGDSGIDMTSYRASDPLLPATCNHNASLPAMTAIDIPVLQPGIGVTWLSAESVSLDARCRYSVEIILGSTASLNDTITVDSVIFVPDRNLSNIFIMADGDQQRDYINCELSLVSLSRRQMALTDQTCIEYMQATTLQMAQGSKPCACDSEGTLPGTTCDSQGGQCRCKPGVYGRQCEVCEPGFYNKTLAGCVPCNCNLNGSLNGVCDYKLGQCPCRPNVATAVQTNVLGIPQDRQCQSCIVDYFGHRTGAGCRPCECNLIGANRSQCNDTGQCDCKLTIGGLQCNQCQPGYYAFTAAGCTTCNCSVAGSLGVTCIENTGQCPCKQNVEGLQCSSCKTGSFNLQAKNPSGCQSCFCYEHGMTCTSALGYSALTLMSITTEIEGWQMANPFGTTSVSATHLTLPVRYLGFKQASYGTNMTFAGVTRAGAFVDYSTPNSIILIGDGGKRIWYNSPVPLVASGSANVMTVQLWDSMWRINQTSPPTTKQFYRILADLTAIYIQRIFTPNIVVDLLNVTMQSVQTALPGKPQVTSVEQCSCMPADNVAGLSCELCAKGFRRPGLNGSSFQSCVACDCSGKSLTTPPVCDEGTGVCLNCKNGTTGQHCEVCAEFVDNCNSCTATECGQCRNTYWGLDNDGCEACDCDMVGATTAVCDKGTGQCDCKANVGELQCNVCADNYFNISPTGCQECNECYGLVEIDVNALRAMRDNITDLVANLKTYEQTDAAGLFGPRLEETQSNMDWLLLYLREADSVGGDALEEIRRMNITLQDLFETIGTTDVKLNTALDDVSAADVNTELGRNQTSGIQFLMIETNVVLNSNSDNLTRTIEALLASIKKVQQTMAGVSNGTTGNVLRVSGIVNSIQTGSTRAKQNADDAYLTAQEAQNLHRQTTSSIVTLDNYVQNVNRLRNDTEQSATNVLGNATQSLNIANTALSNGTSMAPIPIDVTSLFNRAKLQENQGNSLFTQSNSAVVNASVVVNTVSNATERTNALLTDVTSLQTASSLYQLRLDGVVSRVNNARILTNRSFEEATRMYDVMSSFSTKVAAVTAQANSALQQVQKIQALGEDTIRDGRILQDGLVTPKGRAETALETAQRANDISAENLVRYNSTFMTAQALSNYSNSVLTDVGVYPSLVTAINTSTVTPADQTCKAYTAQTKILQNTSAVVTTTANNASLRVSAAATKINTILQSFQTVSNIDQTRLASLRTLLTSTRAAFNKDLLMNSVRNLKAAMDAQQVDLNNMKQRKTQLQTQIRRLQDIRSQLKPV